MPNQRAASQTMLTFAVSRTLLDRVEAARADRPGQSRSQFVREALRDKLVALGYAVPAEAVVAPDRAGKGGRKRAGRPSSAAQVERLASAETARLVRRIAHARARKRPGVPAPPRAAGNRPGRGPLIAGASQVAPP